MTDPTPLIGTDVLLKVNTNTPESPAWTTIYGQRGCTLNLKMDTISFKWKGSDRWTGRIPGDRDWSIDLTSMHYLATDLSWETSMAFLRTAYLGDEATNRLQLQLAFPGNHTAIGYGYMETMTLDEPVGAEATVKGSFVADGALEFA